MFSPPGAGPPRRVRGVRKRKILAGARHFFVEAKAALPASAGGFQRPHGCAACEISAATYEVATDGQSKKQRSSGSAIKHGHDNALRNAGNKPGNETKAQPRMADIKLIASYSTQLSVRCQGSSDGGRMQQEWQ